MANIKKLFSKLKKDSVVVYSQHFGQVGIMHTHESHSDGVRDKSIEWLDNLVKEAINKFQYKNKNGNYSVEINNNFYCHLLTEVGLTGFSVDCIQETCNYIADKVNSHDELTLFEY